MAAGLARPATAAATATTAATFIDWIDLAAPPVRIDVSLSLIEENQYFTVFPLKNLGGGVASKMKRLHLKCGENDLEILISGGPPFLPSFPTFHARDMQQFEFQTFLAASRIRCTLS